MVMFLTSKKFKGGIAKRVKLAKTLRDSMAAKFSPQRFIVSVKVVGYYIALSLWPSRLGFFHDYAYYAHNFRVDRLFWLTLLIIPIFGLWAWSIDPIMALWWFVFVACFSQVVSYGQFVAERYTTCINVALCVLLAKYIPGPLFIILATTYFWWSWEYIKAYRNNCVLFTRSMDAHPNAPENANNLGSWWFHHNDPQRAIYPLLISLKLTPFDNTNIHINLAQAYGKVGDYSKALVHCHTALKHAPLDRKKELEEMALILNNQLVKFHQNQKLLKRILK
jgi:tetratricopeptide (TPR) repeat protein